MASGTRWIRASVPIAALAITFATLVAPHDGTRALIIIYIAALATVILRAITRAVTETNTEKQQLRAQTDRLREAEAQAEAARSMHMSDREELRRAAAELEAKAAQEVAETIARLERENEQQLSERDREWFRRGVLAERAGDLKPSADGDRADLVFLDARRPAAPQSGAGSNR